MVFSKPEWKSSEVRDNKSPWKKSQNSQAEGRLFKDGSRCQCGVGWVGFHVQSGSAAVDFGCV